MEEEKQHEVWFEDPQSAALKAELVKKYNWQGWPSGGWGMKIRSSFMC
ncbi:MAG: hypothetical protein M1119_07630 [Firmicutes bacterium]|nr:hypothetical protein [Bacillota bacterium]